MTTDRSKTPGNRTRREAEDAGGRGWLLILRIVGRRGKENCWRRNLEMRSFFQPRPGVRTLWPERRISQPPAPSVYLRYLLCLRLPCRYLRPALRLIFSGRYIPGAGWWENEEREQGKGKKINRGNVNGSGTLGHALRAIR